MTYKLKRDHLTNWDLQDANDRRSIQDEQDIHISERSSVLSTDEFRRSPKFKDRHITPPPPLPKESHTLVYSYNQLPENGVPWAVQAKKEKKMRKKIQKVPPGQGSLAPVPIPKAADVSEDYYSYRAYYQAKNPDWHMRHQQYSNGELIPYDSFDPTQYINPPASPTPHKKSHRRHRRHRKSHHDESNNEDYSQDFHQQVNSPKQYPNLQEHSPPASRDRSKHHHHHHHHHHHQPREEHPQTNEYIDTEFRVADISFKRPERTPFFQPNRNSFQASPPAIYNQASFLPPVLPHYYYRPIPIDYYYTPVLAPDERNAIKSPRIYRANPRADFYDRYLNTVITKY